MTQRSHRRSPLALAVLSLLFYEPMHPYRMQQLIKEWGKEAVINVQQRASIYQTIERLLRAGLIEVAETTRDERWPERTVYRLTEEGRETALAWLREMLSAPAREYPEFPAAISLLVLLPPEDALQQLELRIAALDAELARREAQIRGFDGVLPRIFLIEEEYLDAVLRAELEWVRSVADDLRAGRLTWSEEWLRALASSPTVVDAPPSGGQHMT
jgi:DNA-binding PadR family transcriptional regulator